MAGISRLESAGWRRTISFGVPLVGIAWAVIELLRLQGDDDVDRYPWSALVLASVMALIVFGLLEVVGSTGPENRRKYGWIGIVIGADGRVSTSKTQGLLWTIVLSISIAYLAGIVAFGPSDAGTLFDKVQWEQYLVLLGGPFAAAVLAKVAVVTKVQSGTIQKSATPAASKRVKEQPGNKDPKPDAKPKAADAISNDDGEIDLADTQYLIFNFVAFVYFAAVFVGNIFGKVGVGRFALPNIPEVLLGLTSVSAATYVGTKAAQRDAPRIVSMSPQPVTAGGDVDVLAVNLIPAGESALSAAAAMSIMIKKLVDNPTEDDTAIVGVLSTPPPTTSSVKFTMPAAFADSTVNVRVVTSGAVATEPYRVEVGTPAAAPAAPVPNSMSG